MHTNQRSSTSTLRRRTLPAVAAGLLLSPGLCLSSAVADTILSDHFTGNSRGVPAGWIDIGDSNPNSTVIEFGTLVTVTDTRGGGVSELLLSPAFGGIDYFQLTLDVASMTSVAHSDPQAIAAIGNLNSGYAFLTSFSYLTQSFRVSVSGPTSASLFLPGGPHLPSYAGGAFSYSVTGDTDSFRITSVVDSFDSGDILFSSIGAAGFDSVHDFGGLVAVVMGAESGGSVPDGTIATVAFDRVQLSGTFTSAEPVPEPSTYAACMAVLGAVGGAWWRNRRREKSSMLPANVVSTGGQPVGR